jgi:hypothetical protein
MSTDESTVGAELTDAEIEALHEVELGVEWLHRAHGKLLAFHHNTGHAMEHLAVAETLLRESGHDDIADDVRDRYLPRGVVDGDRWSYDLVESFQHGFMHDVSEFAERTRREVGGGQSHVAERRQEREWKNRSETSDAQ